ncbi:MAG: hypothetical protein LBR60_00800 [Fibrobacter sp.]|nr:hypothetical protein [Fibrobacter sp.]
MASKLVPVLFLFLAACEKESTAGHPVFVKTYVELSIATQAYTSTPEVRVARSKILEKYGYTAASFDSSVTALQNDPKAWIAFQKSVSAYADTLAAHADTLYRDLLP